VVANGKEKVLEAVGQAATKLRSELGESLASVQKFDVPLEAATTSSLEALKAYSLGRNTQNEKGHAAGLPYFERAIELDPNFAIGYEDIGNAYVGLNQLERGNSYYAKAFALRDHTSEREKFEITATYYASVTGEQDKAIKAYQQQIAAYPRYGRFYNYLASSYASLGQYEKAIDVLREAIRIDADMLAPYSNMANSFMAVQRFDDARKTIGQAFARKMDESVFHNALYGMAFLKANAPAMAEQEKWFAERPDYESFGLSLKSDTEAYAGHLGKAREATRRSVESAIHVDSKEVGAIWLENAALREAAFGDLPDARQTAAAGLKLDPTSQSVNLEAASVFAMTGESTRAESMAQDLNKRFPLDTQVQSLWLPAIRAQLELNRKNPSKAIETLLAALPIEYGQIGFVNNISCLYPTYIRGEAYLGAGQGQPAAAEFQKILDHSGIVWNCWTGALAHLGVARANEMVAKSSQGADADAARTRALNAYKEFLAVWKDADPDIPILKQAKAEYAKLQ